MINRYGEAGQVQTPMHGGPVAGLANAQCAREPTALEMHLNVLQSLNGTLSMAIIQARECADRLCGQQETLGNGGNDSKCPPSHPNPPLVLRLDNELRSSSLMVSVLQEQLRRFEQL